MSTFSFVNPLTGKRFEIEGPPTLTEAQARRIFEDQLNAGALVGLKPGDVLDNARQALDGVAGAAGQLAQQVQNIAGSASGALTGALASVTGGVQGALQGAAGQIQGAVTNLGQQATQFASALPSAINSATSVASKALTGISSSVTNLVPTNPINMANLAKQATSLLPIQGLSEVDVRAAMSQATNLVGQAATTLSNIGAGKFGFDATQLEQVGICKPGTASLVTNAANSLTSVLSSPAVFTGKLGINGINDLLSSVPKQDLLQQTLMNSGLNAVAELGIPVSKLDPGALAGTALNAAKSVTDTFNWATGGSLPPAIKSQLDQVARAADFATNFANQATNEAVTQTAEPGAAEDTANRDTVDAAVTRVTGSAKIPEVNYGSNPLAAQAKQSVKIGSEIIDFQKSVLEFSKSFVAYGKSGAADNRDSDKPDIQRMLNDYKLVQQLASDNSALRSQALALERQAKAYQERFNTSAPGQYTILAQLIPLIDKQQETLDAVESKYKTRIESFGA